MSYWENGKLTCYYLLSCLKRDLMHCATVLRAQLCLFCHYSVRAASSSFCLSSSSLRTWPLPALLYFLPEPRALCMPVTRSLVSLPVRLTPLLPLRIVGKHCRRNCPILAPLFLFFKAPSLFLTHWLNISSHGHFQSSVSPLSEYALAACWLFYSLGLTDLLWWNLAPACFLVQVPSCSTVFLGVKKQPKTTRIITHSHVVKYSKRVAVCQVQLSVNYPAYARSAQNIIFLGHTITNDKVLLIANSHELLLVYAPVYHEAWNVILSISFYINNWPQTGQFLCHFLSIPIGGTLRHSHEHQVVW